MSKVSTIVRLTGWGFNILKAYLAILIYSSSCTPFRQHSRSLSSRATLPCRSLISPCMRYLSAAMTGAASEVNDRGRYYPSATITLFISPVNTVMHCYGVRYWTFLTFSRVYHMYSIFRLKFPSMFTISKSYT